MVKTEFRRIVENFLHREFGSNVNVFDKLQSIMWKFRSSTNRKTPIVNLVERDAQEREKLLPLFNIVKCDFDAFALSLIRKKFA